MQYNDLKLFLSGVVSPERQDLLLGAALRLTELGLFSHELAITNALDQVQYSDNATTIATIESVIVTTLLDTLYEHGITVTDTPIPVLLDILNTIYNVDNYGDPIALVDIVNAEESAEETWAEIMSLLTSRPIEESLPYFTSVSPALIQRVGDIVTQAEESLDPNLTDDGDGEAADKLAESRARLKTFTENHSGLLITQNIVNGVGLALPFDSYVEQNREALEGMGPKELAIELYGMALASDLPSNEIVPLLNETVHEFIADNNDLIQAMSILNTY